MSYDTPPGPRLDGARQLGLDLVGVADRDELAAPAPVDQADDPAQLMTELAEVLNAGGDPPRRPTAKREPRTVRR